MSPLPLSDGRTAKRGRGLLLPPVLRPAADRPWKHFIQSGASYAYGSGCPKSKVYGHLSLICAKIGLWGLQQGCNYVQPF
jgi:hypothetical protein